MEDLIREEDFEVKYNPWRYFLLFYGIAVIQFVLALLITFYVESDFLYILPVFSPIVMAYLMVFINKKLYVLPVKTIMLGVAGILSVYCIMMMVLFSMASGEFGGPMLAVEVSLLYFLVCLAGIGGRIWRMQKKMGLRDK